MAYGSANVPGRFVGNAGTATKLKTARTIKVNLSSTTAESFDGSADITPGVSGVLGTANGGLGNNSGYVRKGQKSGTTVGSHATIEGYDNVASGENAHAEGTKTIARGANSHAAGYLTVADCGHQTVVGRCNVKRLADDDTSLYLGDFFVVGDGSGDGYRANLFRVSSSGICGTTQYNSTGADYAELFEWEDNNPNNEDRVGRFVTLDGEKIRLAASEDDFILGIISGAPSVVGDVHDDQWQGMYLYDIYGRPIWEEVEVPAQTAEGQDPENPENTITRMVIPTHTERRKKINPDYDNSQRYIPRSERSEWGCVGMMGKLAVVDDGTCEVNGWCRYGGDGVATASTERTDFRFMARLDETHVRVLMLGR